MATFESLVAKAFGRGAMTPEEFAKAKEHFLRLVDLRGDERTAALEMLEAEDRNIASEVRSLLDNHRSRTILQGALETRRDFHDSTSHTKRTLGFHLWKFHSCFSCNSSHDAYRRNPCYVPSRSTTYWSICNGCRQLSHGKNWKQATGGTNNPLRKLPRFSRIRDFWILAEIDIPALPCFT